MSKTVRVLTVIALVLGVTGAGLFRARTRPRYAAGLPAYDYKQETRSASVEAVSTTGLMLPARQADSGIKVFQLDRSKLEVDHCSISRVSLTLHKQGTWTLHLRAQQNPALAPGNNATAAVSPATPRFVKYTDFLKRNLFVVKVRCFGGYAFKETAPDRAPGQALLLALPDATFWVQRGAPYDFAGSGHFEAALFERIDRMEVEFYYR